MNRYQVVVFDRAEILASPEIDALYDERATNYAQAQLTVFRNATRVTVRRVGENAPFATFEKESAR